MKLGKRLRAAAALLLSAVMLLWTGLPVTAAYENPKEASVSAAWGFFQADKRFLKSQSQGGSDMPRAGDIAFYSETGDAAALTHVGLVTGAEKRHTVYH